MRVTEKQLLPTFNSTLTIFNKLAAADSLTKRDVWYLNVVDNCFFGNQTVRTAQGAVVSIGNAFLARIPNSFYYKPYKDWINNIDTSFTLNVGDYVFLNELTADEIDIVNTNNILNIYNKHKGYAFVVKTVKNNNHSAVPLPHIKIEGV